MQKQPLKSVQIGNLTASETAEGSTVTLGIGDQTTTLTREDFSRLVNEFFTRETILKCGACGDEMTGSVELSENTATITVEPCKKCATKEPTNHENT